MNRQTGVATIVTATALHVPACRHKKACRRRPIFIDRESLLLGNAVLTKAPSCRKQKRTVGTSASLHHDTTAVATRSTGRIRHFSYPPTEHRPSLGYQAAACTSDY
jgi:hypothetical protein